MERGTARPMDVGFAEAPAIRGLLLASRSRRPIPSASDHTLVFDIAAFAILAWIVAHGLTDTVAGGWIERRVR